MGYLVREPHGASSLAIGLATHEADEHAQELVDQESQRAALGSFVGQFELVRSLASGVESVAYLVRNRIGGDYRVLKRYHSTSGVDVSALQALSLNPPSCFVRIIDCRVDDGQVSELQEFISGGTLRELLTCEPVSSRSARELLIDFLGIIRALEDRGLIYSDLKPSNVYVRKRHPIHIALGDFGSVRLGKASAVSLGKGLSARYHAPEAVASRNGERHVNSKSVFWSLGMLLVELLCGKHPLWDLDDSAALRFICTHDIPVSEVPTDWETLIRGLLVSDPQRRFGLTEVTRWLDGDRSLGAGRPSQRSFAASVCNFVFDRRRYRNLRELASGLAANWELALKYCRGEYLSDLAADVRRYLGDSDVASFLDSLQGDSNSADVRLMMLLERIRPVAAPFFRGEFLSRSRLEKLARDVILQTDDGGRDAEYLAELCSAGALRQFSCVPEIADIGFSWEAGIADFDYVLAMGRRAHCVVEVNGLARLQVYAFALLFAVCPDDGDSFVSSLREQLGWPNVARLRELVSFINSRSPMQMTAFHRVLEVAVAM